jgi:hypothetical protein
MERLLACRSVQSGAQPEDSRVRPAAAGSNSVSAPQTSMGQPEQQSARRRPQVSTKRTQVRRVQLAAEQWARPELVS